MSDAGDDDQDGLAAGDFSSWIVDMQAAIRSERGSDVPCGSCTACCISSQFIHIAPDETDTLTHIHPELLFPAHADPPATSCWASTSAAIARCSSTTNSIYEHRPTTCRTYDCRVFAAAGVDDPDETKVKSPGRRDGGGSASPPRMPTPSTTRCGPPRRFSTSTVTCSLPRPRR